MCLRGLGCRNVLVVVDMFDHVEVHMLGSC